MDKNSNLNKAKKLYFKYDGSQFYMSHDGADEKYNKYNISKEIESVWKEELIIQRMHEYEVSSNFMKLHTLIYYSRFNLLEKIINVKVRGSYINKLVVLEMLIDFIIKNKKNIKNDLIKKSKKIIFQEYIKLNNIEIPKKYVKNNVKSRTKEIKKALDKLK